MTPLTLPVVPGASCGVIGAVPLRWALRSQRSHCAPPLTPEGPTYLGTGDSCWPVEGGEVTAGEVWARQWLVASNPVAKAPAKYPRKRKIAGVILSEAKNLPPFAHENARCAWQEILRLRQPPIRMTDFPIPYFDWNLIAAKSPSLRSLRS